MFCSASEIAFLSASKLHIRYLREKKNKAAARVEKLMKRKDFFINTILVCNNIVNIAISSIATAIAVQLTGSAGVGIATAIATVVILVFGEILPKSFALLIPEKIALKFSFPLMILVFVMSPVVSVISGFIRIIMKLFRVRTNTDKTTVTEEDLKTLIEVGTEQGVIETKESAMMRKIFNYTDLNARDIMTPRTDISFIPVTATRSEILQLSDTSTHSRFPVYGKDLDDILGILYVKDFLFTDIRDPEQFSLKKIMRPALFIFENQKISVLQKQLQEANQNVAIIIDEYGGTSGIVTTEDIIEEVFGGIRDEYDTPARIPKGKDSGEKAAGEDQPQETGNGETLKTEEIIPGNERLDILNEHLGIHLASEFYDTIAGFIMEKTDALPSEGTSVTEQGFTFTVDKVRKNRIDTVTVRLAAEDETGRDSI
ncbi:hemolysin family protein [Brucepastera parasyntrophica]|uniref:hemolysin family protein n=1 Tax=Brucepastera parasyntrophica TaxID=2880008 RepID=UPI002109B571|nr:hemolysin family protein [Brucepastera parasyntrophica]